MNKLQVDMQKCAYLKDIRYFSNQYAVVKTNFEQELLVDKYNIDLCIYVNKNNQIVISEGGYFVSRGINVSAEMEEYYDIQKIGDKYELVLNKDNSNEINYTLVAEYTMFIGSVLISDKVTKSLIQARIENFKLINMLKQNKELNIQASNMLHAVDLDDLGSSLDKQNSRIIDYLDYLEVIR